MSTFANNEYSTYATMERPEMLRYVPEDARRVLDVGCSVGNFGRMIKKRQPAEVWGVEIDANAAEQATKSLDRVTTGPFVRGVELGSEKFDCIVFNDVLEHMVDPYEALDVAKAYLAPGGVVVASIPNVRYFGNMWLLVVHKSWKYEDAGILDRTHLRFFTEKSIRSMFLDQGYKVETLEGINPLEKFDGYFIRKFRVLNLLAFNNLSDMRWYQFAVVASVKREAAPE